MIDSKKIIKESGLVPNKALGQNFLTDVSAVTRIAELSRCNGKHVLEIGPGLGVLTGEFSKTAVQVTAVEIDSQMVAFLTDLLSARANVRIVNKDFLKLTVNDITELTNGSGFTVAANLPYYITSAAAMKLIDSPLPIERMVLMMQTEAADHFTAGPRAKCYTPVSVLSNRYYRVTKEFELSPSSYYPEPAVSSAVLLFERNGIPYDPSFSKLVKAAFAMRRKTLRNNLSGLIPKETVPAVIESAGLNASCRAEELSVDDFVKLNDALALR